MSKEKRLVFNIEEIARVVLHCTKCTWELTTTQLYGITIPNNCPGCGSSWRNFKRQNDDYYPAHLFLAALERYATEDEGAPVDVKFALTLEE